MSLKNKVLFTDRHGNNFTLLQTLKEVRKYFKGNKGSLKLNMNYFASLNKSNGDVRNIKNVSKFNTFRSSHSCDTACCAIGHLAISDTEFNIKHFTDEKGNELLDFNTYDNYTFRFLKDVYISTSLINFEYTSKRKVCNCLDYVIKDNGFGNYYQIWDFLFGSRQYTSSTSILDLILRIEIVIKYTANLVYSKNTALRALEY